MDDDIDRDERVCPYQLFLLECGLKYDNTRRSAGGGVRLYTNGDISVEVMREVPHVENGLQWCVMKALTFRELGHGKGLYSLESRLCKLGLSTD